MRPDPIDMDLSKAEVITSARAEQIIYTWLRNHKGKMIIGEDLRRVVYARNKCLRHPNCWGWVIRKLINDRWLQEFRVPPKAMTSAKSNARRSIVYMVRF